MTLTKEEFQLWTKYIHDTTGIFLDDSKGYLIEPRFDPLIKEPASTSFGDLLSKVKADYTYHLRKKVIEAITTNETSFFRDTSPFDLLQNKILPDLIDKRTKTLGRITPLPIRIWSAASSTGQEVYSISIVLKELLIDLSKYDIRILGTDISNQAVAKASYAHYSRMELDRGMTADKLSRYFTTDGTVWKVKDELRALSTFKTMNLLEPFSFPTKFDIIFCRNVAIYFTEADKTRLFQKIGQVLAPDGFLIIGSTE